MSTKSNIRSFRYSDLVAELLEKQEGKSLNEKFENLVRFCHEAVPNKRRELALLDEAIEAKRKAYYEIAAQLQSVNSLINTLKTVEMLGKSAAEKARQIAECEDCNTIAAS